MRHLNAGKKLGVGPDHRTALLRSLTLALIEKQQIRTLLSRAKALRWHADHVVTLAKRGDLHSRRQIISLLGCSISGNGENRVRSAIDKVYSDLVPRYKTRNGGYTQIFRFSQRRPGDNAEMCLMRYIPDEADEKGSKKATKGQKDKSKSQVDKKDEKKPVEKKAASKETSSTKKVAEPEDKTEKSRSKKTKEK